MIDYLKQRRAVVLGADLEAGREKMRRQSPQGHLGITNNV
jgi:hypothetical protein